MNTTTEKVEIYTWQQFAEDIDILAAKVKNYCENRQPWPIKIDAVVAIPRGGLCLGVCLSHRLDAKFYTLKEFCHLCKESPENVLLVDDITDTGDTLNQAWESFDDADFVRNFDVFTAAIYHNTAKDGVPAMWYVRNTDKWVIFPWEA